MDISFVIELGSDKDTPEMVNCYEKVIRGIFEGCEDSLGVSLDFQTGLPKDPEDCSSISENQAQVILNIPEATEDTVSRFKDAVRTILACNPTRDKGQYVGYMP